MPNSRKPEFYQLKNRVMLKISEEPGMTTAEIGKRIRVDSPSALRSALDELKNEGKIYSKPDPDSSRLRLLWYPFSASRQ